MTGFAYIAGFLVFCLFACFVVFVGRVVINGVLERPSGLLREWHRTIPHSGSDASFPSSYEQWDAAVAILDVDAKLIREWHSPYTYGDGVYREYRIDDTYVLIELDRLNGFTISGKRAVAEPLSEQIESEAKV
ncbi:hypothetical protein SH528x_002771 [Novipirellula sp. SH528]|uniref:hypothetical protein n=1 Tax=Novipirellula sp. SH528 TaxID=3454466 RepID=UPI003FA0D8FD